MDILTERYWTYSLLDLSIKVCTAQKMKFSVKDFFSKCDPIRRRLQIWSHLLKKSLMENCIFCVVMHGFSSKVQRQIQYLRENLRDMKLKKNGNFY